MSLVSLAHTLCEAGRAQEAEELCRLVLAEQPRLIMAQTALGRVLYEEGKLDEAESWLNLTIGAAPGSFAAHRWLAEVLVHRGAFDRARTVLEQARVISPDNARVRQLLGNLPGAAPPQAPTPLPVRATPSRALPPMPPPIPEPMRGTPRESPSAPVQAPLPRHPRTEEYPASAFDDPRVDEDLEVPIVVESWLRPPDPPRMTGSIPVVRASGGIPIVPLTPPQKNRPAWRAIAAAMLVGMVLAAGAVAALLAFPRTSQVAPASSSSARPDDSGRGSSSARSGTPRDGRPTRQLLEQAIARGALGELLDAASPTAPPAQSPEGSAAQLFAAALLATEYGLPVAGDAPARLDRLEQSGPAGLSSELAATRLLLSVARGAPPRITRPTDGSTASPWLAFAEARARWLGGSGASADGPPEGPTTTAIGPAVVLRAQMLIDRGEPARAERLLAGLLASAPNHAPARLALAEAHAAIGLTPSTDEATALRGACTVDGKRSRIVEAACDLATAEELRRKGQRAQARERALRIAVIDPPDARLLARTAQLMANLGETGRAEELVTRAGTRAAAGFPALDWAVLAVRTNRGQQPDLDRAPPTAGPESRLIAVRAALASGGAVGVTRVLRGIAPQQIKTDPDLGWFAALPRIQQRRAAARMADHYATSVREPPGPVGAYVLGLLARWGGRRYLAARWLAQANQGHGDACSAAALYVTILEQMRRPVPPTALPAECPRTPAAPATGASAAR